MEVESCIGSFAAVEVPVNLVPLTAIKEEMRSSSREASLPVVAPTDKSASIIVVSGEVSFDAGILRVSKLKPVGSSTVVVNPLSATIVLPTSIF